MTESDINVYLFSNDHIKRHIKHHFNLNFRSQITWKKAKDTVENQETTKSLFRTENLVFAPSQNKHRWDVGSTVITAILSIRPVDQNMH